MSDGKGYFSNFAIEHQKTIEAFAEAIVKATPIYFDRRNKVRARLSTKIEAYRKKHCTDGESSVESDNI